MFVPVPTPEEMARWDAAAAAAGIAEEIETLGSLPGTVTLLQVSADGYTVQQLLYAEGEMRALYDAETGYTVWRAEPRLRFDSGVNP